MQHTSLASVAAEIEASSLGFTALFQLLTPLFMITGILLVGKSLFAFKSAMDGSGGSLGEGWVQMMGGVFLMMGSSVFMSGESDADLSKIRLTPNSPGEVFFELTKKNDQAAKLETKSSESEQLEWFSAESTLGAESKSKDNCHFIEGGYASYRGGKVEILLDQGNGWYRVKNEYGESSSKQKTDLECSK